jgi:hypothetical protein
MDNPSKGHLPFGRVAFAKAFCADWISEHSKIILVSLATFLVLCFCLFQFMGRFSNGNKSDYLEAQTAFSAWTAHEVPSHKIPKALANPLNRHPELQAKFGTHIAQRLLAFGETKNAGRYAGAAFKRSQDLKTPYYDRFSRNTLAIAGGEYLSALEEAKRLKSDLEADDAFWQSRDSFVRSGAILYAYNLMRIASLERELGSKEGEKKAWEELLLVSGWRGTSTNKKVYDEEAYAFLAQNFTQGDISLLDYIEQRMKNLE